MAKLSANGAHEVARWVRGGPETDPASLTDHAEHHVVLRSDGVLLAKHKVHFKPDSYKPAGYWHDWGWTVQRRFHLKPGVAMESLAARLDAHFTAGGYEQAQARGAPARAIAAEVA